MVRVKEDRSEGRELRRREGRGHVKWRKVKGRGREEW